MIKGGINPTVLKWVARSFNDPTLNGSSGLLAIATKVRENTSYEGTDREVVKSYFDTLGKPSTPTRGKCQVSTKPTITERTDFSLPTGRSPDLMPWD